MVLAALVLLPLAGMAQEAQTVLHLLDYIGVDYPEAIESGKVRNEAEYQEMLEFTSQVSSRLGGLPENPRKGALISQSEALASLVANKAPAPAVAAASSTLRWNIVDAYKLRLAPRVPPSVESAGPLYARYCAACHGAEGHGNGPAAQGLEPAPSDFHDQARMAQRSAYGLYNTITLGVAGTSMASFRRLSDMERWALAFFVANLGVSAERVARGEQLWSSGKGRDVFSDLGPVATLSTREMAQRHGDDAARMQDYLRAQPGALRPAPLAFARQKLAESAQSYRAGEVAAARDAAIVGYLEGFELAEAALANIDPALMRETERRMLDFRSGIEDGIAPDALQRQADEIDALLVSARQKLGAQGLSSGSAFAASLIILLREGLEAILVLAAIIAFVLKTGRRDALPWVHAGWIAALVLGGATWALAAFVIEISGANRELTEGFAALLAAAMLLYVGYWLHGKSYAQAWNRFIKEQVGQALAKRTLWAMAAVSFLAVYREMFEIVLFYQALWVQAGEAARGSVLGGIAAAALLLAAVGFLLLKYSIRLPIGPFFSATSILLAALAVVFTGHGVAALQEAGLIGATSLPFPAVPLLGIYPSGETTGAQLLVLVAVALSFFSARPGSLSVKNS